MTQTATMISNGDWYAGGSPLNIPTFPVTDGTSLVLTVAYYNSGSAMNAGNRTNILNAGWTEVVNTNGGSGSGINIYTHVFTKNVTSSGTESIANVANDDNLGCAYTIMEFAGDVTGFGTPVIAADPSPLAQNTQYNVPDISTGFTAGNSTYAITISGTDSSGNAGPSGYTYGEMSDTDLGFIEHILTPNGGDGDNANTNWDLSETDNDPTMARGSSNQHYFAAGKLVPSTSTYTEVTASSAQSTSVIMMEVEGNVAAAAPIISSMGAGNITSDGWDVVGTTDTASGTLFYVVGESADMTGITVQQVINGEYQDSSSAPGNFSGSATITQTDLSNITFSGIGLVEGTSYVIAYAQVANAINSTTTETTSFTVNYTASTLTNPTAINANATTDSVTVGGTTDKFDTNDTVYAVVDTVANIAALTTGQAVRDAAVNQTHFAEATHSLQGTTFGFAVTNGDLIDQTTYAVALVHEYQGLFSDPISVSFTVGASADQGFRLPMVDKDGTAAADETGLTIAVYDDADLTNLLGSVITTGAISAGELEIPDSVTGYTTTTSSTYFIRVYRTASSSAWTTNADNRNIVVEAISVDLTNSNNNSIDG